MLVLVLSHDKFNQTDTLAVTAQSDNRDWFVGGEIATMTTVAPLWRVLRFSTWSAQSGCTKKAVLSETKRFFSRHPHTLSLIERDRKKDAGALKNTLCEHKPQGSYHRDTAGLTGLRYCIPRGRTCRCSNTYQTHQSRPGPVSLRGNLYDRKQHLIK